MWIRILIIFASLWIHFTPSFNLLFKLRPVTVFIFCMSLLFVMKMAFRLPFCVNIFLSVFQLTGILLMFRTWNFLFLMLLFFGQPIFVSFLIYLVPNLTISKLLPLIVIISLILKIYVTKPACSKKHFNSKSNASVVLTCFPKISQPVAKS